MATRGKSARSKGNNYELEIMHKFRENGFPECVTSRNESRMNDALKIDLCNSGRFSVQCKAQEKLVTSLHDELKSMPINDKINLVFHKRNNKGSIVAMKESDFWLLLKELNEGI